PFRMEMSGFARLEGSIPVTGDIGVLWPIVAHAVEERLGLRFDFVSAPQESEEGKQMRDWIVDEVPYVNRALMYDELRKSLMTHPGSSRP
ncbi:MAG: hypothetical protein ABI076_08440, partial [Acidobacteriaceae bacterium]